MTRKYDSLLGAWNGKPRRRTTRRGNQTFIPPVPVEDILQIANSNATKAIPKKAERLLSAFVRKNSSNDPEEVTASSSDVVINLIAQHCNYQKPNMLGYECVLALCQGLRNVYSNYGHRSSWNPKAEKGCLGNPLINKQDLNRFRRAYRVMIARNGGMKLRARPISVDMVCDLSEKFWFGNGGSVKAEDILLHSILVIGLNLGLRYDEVLKLSYQHVSTTSNSIILTIPAATKNSTTERVHHLLEWTGSSSLRYSIIMDPFVALLSWLCVRGPYDGYLFCNIKGTNAGSLLQHDTAFSDARFRELLRDRLCLIGIGKRDLLAYAGHSLKRGAVQLNRSLGYKDEFIMELVKSSDFASYSNYCEVYNDSQSSLPRFSSIAAFLNHAVTVADEQMDEIEEDTQRDIFE